MTLLSAKTLDRLPVSETIDAFSLVIRYHVVHTKIDMNIISGTVNTRDIPWTFDYLKQYLPSILSSTCFNEEQIPFSIEVKRTELGHLFEHILLEYLCEEKLRQGYDEAVFSGRTNWNWEREPFGLFHIYIDMQQTDRALFPDALRRSIALFDTMLKYQQHHTHSFASEMFTPPQVQGQKPLTQ